MTDRPMQPLLVSEATAHNAVPLSQPHMLGTAGQVDLNPQNDGTSARTAAGTEILKSLAHCILLRDGQRDEKRDTAPETCPTAGQPAGATVGTISGARETPVPWSESEDERAAIIEYKAGVPRTWAEGFARLHPDHPPADVPPQRWQQFVDDCGQFLDGGFAATAAALGWGTYDLFGCDRDRPFARIDQCGLLWLLNGAWLIALTAETATIEARAGVRQSYRRRPAAPGRVLVWKLTS